jgi:hypothetical protein
MHAFMGGAIRTVDIPAAELVSAGLSEVLELAFRYGQNDVQPKQFTSVSVGDVVRYQGRRFRVASNGFEELAALTDYEDANGNLLDEDEVAALNGAAS